MATTDFTLQDIVKMLADKLQPASGSQVSISQVTVTVTYAVKQKDFIDEWYEEYLAHQDENVEVPFI